MDVRYVFSALVAAFCIFLFFAMITSYRNIVHRPAVAIYQAN